MTLWHKEVAFSRTHMFKRICQHQSGAGKLTATRGFQGIIWLLLAESSNIKSLVTGSSIKVFLQLPQRAAQE